MDALTSRGQYDREGIIFFPDRAKRQSLHKALKRAVRNKGTSQTSSSRAVSTPLVHHLPFKDRWRKPARVTRPTMSVWRDTKGKSFFKSSKEMRNAQALGRDLLYLTAAPVYFPFRGFDYRRPETFRLQLNGPVHENVFVREHRTGLHPSLRTRFAGLGDQIRASFAKQAKALERFSQLENARKAIRRNPTETSAKLSAAREALEKAAPARAMRFSKLTQRRPRIRVRKSK